MPKNWLDHLHSCPRCGGSNDSRHEYCGWCGCKLVRQSATALQDAAERKHVTILFADIVESTAMLKDFDPERSTAIIDPLLGEMARIVADESGFVGRLAGDGVKALFGVPAARKGHAHRACIAALRIRDMARTRRVRVRIGLHSGEVVLRHLRPDILADYDAVGMAVHLAARLEQSARPGTIRISGTTAGLVAERFILRRLNPLTPKGISGPVEAFELVRPVEGAGGHRPGPGNAGGVLIGRRGELATLLAGIQGKSRVISVSGEAGAGKSRLVAELLRRRELASWTVLYVEVEAEGGRTGLRPFARLLHGLLRVGRYEPPAEVSARLDALLLELNGLAEPDVGALRRLLDLPHGSSLATYEQTRIVRSLRTTISRYAARRPTLLVVEDVHWLDEDGLKLLSLLSADAAETGFVLLQTFRTAPETLSATGIHVTLSPLSNTESRQLLEAALGCDSEFDQVKERILERAEGIPLFLTELARYIASTTTGQTTVAVPDTIQAVIGERIDGLPKRCRELLRVASVIGRVVPLPLLCHVMSCSETALEPNIRRLEQDDFVHLRAEPTERCLVFDHILTRDVAYASMVKATRRVIHQAVLNAHEALYASRLDEHLETLGAHAAEAGAWEQARAYLQQAAEKAINLSTHSKAVVFIQEALRALAQTDQSADSKAESELQLRLLLRVAFNAMGNYKERLINLDRAETLATKLGKGPILASLWVSRASVLLQLGHVNEAIRLCVTAGQCASRQDDHETRIIAGYMLSRNYFYAGRLSASLLAAERTLEFLGKQPGRPRHGGGFGSSEVMLLTQLAQTFACQGDFVGARTSAAQALSAASRTGRNFDSALASYGLGVVHFYEGDVAAPLDVLEQGLKASLSDGAQSIYAALGGLLSYAYLRAGRIEDASVLVRHVLSYAEDSLYQANWPRLFGSMVATGTGDTDEAIRLAEVAYRVACKGGYPVQVIWSDLILTHLLAALRSRRAERHLEHALIASRRMGIRPCRARALIELGNLQRARGHEREAHESWRKGRRLAVVIGLKTDGDAPLFTREVHG